MVTGGWTRRDFFRRAGAAGAVAIGGPVLLGSCGDGEGRGSNTLQQGREQGFLRTGIANEPPYTEVTAGGEVTGVEPDIAKAVLKKLGIDKLQGIVTPYDQMIPGLQAGRWDMVTAGLFMKKSRCAEVLYSEPTIVSTESFGVKAGNPKNVTSVASVKQDSSLKVAALGGAFEEGILKDAGVPAGQIVAVRDGRSGIEAVKAGRADAFFLPTLSLNELVGNDKSIEVTDPVEDAPVTGAGHAFRKNDTEMHTEYNKALAEMKKTDEYANILDKWGFDADSVKGVTTEQLCKTEG
ncbi:MAG: ectoine/hydroxyectoine ABC transporter substrate-binding protein EhuB [Actinophytocola sp.]|nr:ectoine/hydroxyectoine ABC transporter substrate-binding protein EhuB [Actinophytocola sp.]